MPRRAVSLAVATALACLVACGGTDGDTVAPTAPAPTTATTTAPPTTLPTTTAVPAGRPYDVARAELVVEDDTRPTMAAPGRGLAERPTRTLPVLLLTPVGDGPFPIVVFSHGVTASGPAYEPFLARLAAAGFVVAAPTFPLSSGPGATIVDYTNQPGDVYAVLDAVVESEPRVDGGRVALAGHSLGAMTTVGAAYHSCCADARIGAAVVLSGIEAPFPGGDFGDRPPVPLLLAHGDADPTIDVDGSERLFASATGPATFVRFPGAGHSDLLVGAAGDVLVAAVVAWLDRWLLEDPSGFDAFVATAGDSGVAELTSKG